jgi:hypothetical protein
VGYTDFGGGGGDGAYAEYELCEAGLSGSGKVEYVSNAPLPSDRPVKRASSPELAGLADVGSSLARVSMSPTILFRSVSRRCTQLFTSADNSRSTSDMLS